MFIPAAFKSSKDDFGKDIPESIPSLVQQSGRTEIGDLVVFKICTEREETFSIIDGGLRQSVVDGQLLTVSLGEYPVEILLCDAQGITFDRKVVTPDIVEPRLLSLDLPPQVSYETNSLYIAMTVEEVDSVSIEYRISDDQWLPISSADMDGFDLYLPRQRCCVELRIQLKSRHFHLTEKGILTEYRQVSVTHPEPSIRFDIPKLYRFDIEAAVSLFVVWAEKIEVLFNGETFYPESINDEFHFDIPVSTDAVGEQEIRLEVTSLDGVVTSYKRKIKVLPRASSCQVKILPTGSLCFKIIAGNNITFSVPSRQTKLENIGSAGEIVHQFVFGAAGIFHWFDDMGKACSRDINLKVLPKIWSPNLTGFSKLQGWRSNQ